MDRLIRLLKKVGIFQRLSPAVLKRIAGLAAFRSFRKDETIFTAAATGDCLYVLLKGRIKIYATAANGRVKTLAYLEAGDFFGEMALIEDESRSASARVLTDTEVALIHQRDFRRLLKDNPELSFEFMRTLCYRLRRADAEISALTFQNVVGRIAMILLDLSQRYGQKSKEGNRIQIPLTHQELSELGGTAREVVTRALNIFRRSNCINYDQHYITILNGEKLRGWIY